MPSVSWGTPITVNEQIVVGNRTEIPAGQMAWVINASTLTYETIVDRQWEAFLKCDLSQLQREIESKIRGSKVQWIGISWDKDEKVGPSYFDIWEQRWVFHYHIYGFRVEAIVKNEGAALTGLEIFYIIMAATTLLVVIALVTLGSWTTVQVISAAQQIGPVATIGIGLAVLAGVGLLAFVLLGGKASVKSKERRFEIGRG